MYERAFRFSGHEVILAYDGEVALKELKNIKEVPAAIVLDIMMPHMNGLDLIINLRQDPRFKEVPMIVLTNSFHKEEADHFLSSGADLYLVKIEHPSNEVVEKVEDLITKGH